MKEEISIEDKCNIITHDCKKHIMKEVEDSSGQHKLGAITHAYLSDTLLNFACHTEDLPSQKLLSDVTVKQEIPEIDDVKQEGTNNGPKLENWCSNSNESQLETVEEIPMKEEISIEDKCNITIYDSKNHIKKEAEVTSRLNKLGAVTQDYLSNTLLSSTSNTEDLPPQKSSSEVTVKTELPELEVLKQKGTNELDFSEGANLENWSSTSTQAQLEKIEEIPIKQEISLGDKCNNDCKKHIKEKSEDTRKQNKFDTVTHDYLSNTLLKFGCHIEDLPPQKLSSEVTLKREIPELEDIKQELQLEIIEKIPLKEEISIGDECIKKEVLFSDTSNKPTTAEDIYQESVCFRELEPDIKHKSKKQHTKDIELVFTCTECVFITRHLFPLVRHFKVKHGVTFEDINPGTEVRMYKCKKCNYHSKGRSLVRRHLITHNEQGELFSCDDCDYQTKYRSALIKHTDTQHGLYSRIYECAECRYKSEHRYLFMRHVNLQHSKTVKKYKCYKCDFETKRKDQLGRHNRSKHSETISLQEMYKCSECSFVATRKDNLKRHADALHNKNVQIYKCKACAYDTKRKYNLAQHMAAKHNASNETFK